MKPMRRHFVSILLFISSGFALAGPQEDALQVLQKWTKAFTDSDVDTIVSLYAPSALFFGTGSKTLVTAPSDIRAYFERALLNEKPRSAALREHSVLVLSDTAVVVTGLDIVTGVRDGNATTSYGRVTFVVEKRGAVWQIVHFHRSAVPN